MANSKIDSLKVGDSTYDITLPVDATPSIASLTTSTLRVTSSANLTDVTCCRTIIATGDLALQGYDDLYDKYCETAGIALQGCRVQRNFYNMHTTLRPAEVTCSNVPGLMGIGTNTILDVTPAISTSYIYTSEYIATPNIQSFYITSSSTISYTDLTLSTTKDLTISGGSIKMKTTGSVTTSCESLYTNCSYLDASIRDVEISTYNTTSIYLNSGGRISISPGADQIPKTTLSFTSNLPIITLTGRVSSSGLTTLSITSTSVRFSSSLSTTTSSISRSWWDILRLKKLYIHDITWPSTSNPRYCGNYMKFSGKFISNSFSDSIKSGFDQFRNLLIDCNNYFSYSGSVSGRTEAYSVLQEADYNGSVPWSPCNGLYRRLPNPTSINDLCNIVGVCATNLDYSSQSDDTDGTDGAYIAFKLCSFVPSSATTAKDNYILLEAGGNGYQENVNPFTDCVKKIIL